MLCVSVSDNKLRGRSSNYRGTRGRGRGHHSYKDTKVTELDSGY